MTSSVSPPAARTSGFTATSCEAGMVGMVWSPKLESQDPERAHNTQRLRRQSREDDVDVYQLEIDAVEILLRHVDDLVRLQMHVDAPSPFGLLLRIEKRRQ